MLEPAGRRAAVVAGPHDVEQHRRIVVDAVLVAPEPAVVPAQPKSQEVDPGLRRELDFAGHVRALTAVHPGADHQPLRRLLRLGERLVVHRHLAGPRVVPAGDMQDGNIGVIAHMVDDRHPLDVPEWGLGPAPHRLDQPRLVLRDDSQGRVAGPDRQAVDMLADAPAVLDQAPAASAGLASAALLFGAPIWKIQFMNRSSNAPPCLMPLTPQFDTASIGTMVVRWGGFISARACWVPPGITRAEGADLAVGPVLAGDPFDDVEAVLRDRRRSAARFPRWHTGPGHRWRPRRSPRSA